VFELNRSRDEDFEKMNDRFNEKEEGMNPQSFNEKMDNE
jgi:hypothetical protein